MEKTKLSAHKAGVAFFEAHNKILIYKKNMLFEKENFSLVLFYGANIFPRTVN